MKNGKFLLVKGRANKKLADDIAENLGITSDGCSFLDFSDGEFEVEFDNARGRTVFIIQSTQMPANNLLELLFMVDTAKRASASRIIAVITYFGFARQDKKYKPRISIGAKIVANLLVAVGVDRVVTMDLHADQIQGFFDIPVDHLHASWLFVPYIQSLKLDNLVVTSPDLGGVKRADKYAKFLKAPMVVTHKKREKANVVGEMTVIGDVKDKDVVIIDDMVDTAGTLSMAANIIADQGAKSVRAFATHAVLSGSAYDRINDSALTELVVTDSIPLKQRIDKIKVLSVAELLADVMKKVYNYQSISSMFIV